MTDVVRLRPRARPRGQELLDHSQTGLIGATLRWKRYRRWTASWPIGQCELCGALFTEGGTPGLNSGYSVVGGGPAGQDDYCWVCAVCYDTRRDRFCWTVLDTRGQPSEPPDLLEVAFGPLAWPEVTGVEDDDWSVPMASPLPRSW